MKIVLSLALACVVALTSFASADAGTPPSASGGAMAAPYYREDFEKSKGLPAGWTRQGDVTVADGEKFEGRRAIRVARTKEKFDVETKALGPVFQVVPGPVEVSGAFKAALYSPDVSFNAAILLQCQDGAGKVIERIRIGEFSGETNWTPLRKEVQIQSGAVAARLSIELNKTHGEFWADHLSVAPAVSSTIKKSPVRRVILKTATVGNMLYPGDKPVFEVTVETSAPLAPDRRTLRFAVRDYWGAEQATPGTVQLKESAGAKKEILTYTANLNLADATKIAFETGKYYELAVSVDPGVGEPVREHSSFVFLPEAVTKKYPRQEIPFSSRNWDNRIPAYFALSDRIGIRLLGVWGGWDAQPPYKPVAPGIDLCRNLDAGVLTRTPIISIEHHRPGYEAYTEKALKEGLHEFFKLYGKDKRLMFVLGNEPQMTGETVATNVAFYKMMYEEIKKISPETFVVGTSVGPAEEYFKLGFQNYCDAVDFHTYEDVKVLEGAFEKYDALFAKYGGRKPIWSTETGLNSQGLPRRAIAADLIRKVATFFAKGGQNISWFAICYPDREGKLRGASDDSFNVFDGLYGNYSPRLDAVAYYNMVNAVSIKKFVAHKKDESGTDAFLFRDREGQILQVLWKNGGEEDLFIPLSGVSAVRMIRIDGTIEPMNAAQKGLTLRVGEDPILLLYSGSQKALPDKLGEPEARFVSVPEKITRGEKVKISLSLKGGEAEARAKAGALSIKVPPFWKAGKPVVVKSGEAEVTIEAPADTEARFVPITLSIKDGAAGDSDLTIKVPVQGQLSATIMPVPAVNGQPAVELTVQNNNATPETIQWKLLLQREVPVKNGRYSLEVTQAPGAYFSDAAQGQREIEGNGVAKIRLPIAKMDPIHSYRVGAVIIDKLGRSVSSERYIAGCVGVPKAASLPKMDGVLDEAEWSRCQPGLIHEERQSRSLNSKEPRKWNGPADLSGEIRFLWDEKCLYVGVKVTDNVFRNQEANGRLWAGDGIQLLIDPARQMADKAGKYDYGMALTPKGPQAWCFLSGDGRVSSGEAKEIVVAAKKAGDGTGSITYEIAIPWSRLLPFKPGVGANLGLAMALNEDDGEGRDGFMAWFGDIQSKEVSPVGDLILMDH